MSLALLAAVVAALTAGCGSEGVEVKSRGAQLFADRCAGCHTLKAAGTRGSILGQRPTGPNLNKRTLSKTDVLYAIRNGGFSGAIMPQNIVVGRDAEAVADFVSKYAGREVKSTTGPGGTTGGAGATQPEAGSTTVASDSNSSARKRSGKKSSKR
jgi:mono/diheme cytochrome c family protein